MSRPKPFIKALAALALLIFSAAGEVCGAPSGPSVTERIAGVEKQVAEANEAHLKALQSLADAGDLAKGIEAFRQQAEKLKSSLKDAHGGKDLATEAQAVTEDLMKTVPGGKLDPRTAAQIDLEALEAKRRAQALDGSISAAVKSLEQSLSLASPWAATFKAFAFDPRRQDEITRRLVGQRVLEFQGIDKPAAALAAEKAGQRQDPANAPATAPDPLSKALVDAWNQPGSEQALNRLNAACLEWLNTKGAKVVQLSAAPKFSPEEMANLESAAKFKAPAALQLLALMELTGRGHPLDAPQGIAFLKQASLVLVKHPGMPFGPGIAKEAEADVLRNVGTIPFWLGECSLTGLPNRDLGQACAQYALAVHAGDPRAEKRLRQLADLGLISTADAYRWSQPAVSTRYHGTLGLVELQETSLATLYAKELSGRPPVRAKTEDSHTPPSPYPAAGSYSYLGIELGEPLAGMPGAPVSRIMIGSPADVAGLSPHDIITSIGSTTIRDPQSLTPALAGTRPGQQIVIKGIRTHSGYFQVYATLGTRRALTRSIECVEELISMTARHALQGQRGIRVTSVAQGSRAYAAGLRSYDVITAVSGRPVQKFEQLAEAFQRKGTMIRLTLWRPAEGLDSATFPIEVPGGN